MADGKMMETTLGCLGIVHFELLTFTQVMPERAALRIHPVIRLDSAHGRPARAMQATCYQKGEADITITVAMRTSLLERTLTISSKPLSCMHS